MKTIKNIFFILTCLQFYNVNANNLKEDSLKNNFTITDPRNPHCACHQYQKLADEEYKKLIGKEIKLNANQSNSNFNTSFPGNTNLNSKNKTSRKFFYLNGKRWSLFNHKNKKVTKRRKVKWLRKDNTSCFHF